MATIPAVQPQINPVLLKIKKLLELASEARNPSAHEAQSAMAKVQELLLKYELDMDTVEQGGNTEDEPFETVPYGDAIGRATSQSRFCRWIVQKHFHVRTFTCPESIFFVVGRNLRRSKDMGWPPGEIRLVFLGRKTNVHRGLYRNGSSITTKTAPETDSIFLERLTKERIVVAHAEQREGLVRRNDEEALESYVDSVFPSNSRSHSYRRSRVLGWKSSGPET